MQWLCRISMRASTWGCRPALFSAPVFGGKYALQTKQIHCLKVAHGSCSVWGFIFSINDGLSRAVRSPWLHLDGSCLQELQLQAA